MTPRTSGSSPGALHEFKERCHQSLFMFVQLLFDFGAIPMVLFAASSHEDPSLPCYLCTQWVVSSDYRLINSFLPWMYRPFLLPYFRSAASAKSKILVSSIC